MGKEVLIAMKKKSVVLITDVPTPYRNHLFSQLELEFQNYGLELVVWYMSKAVSNRNWFFDTKLLTYKHEFFKSSEIQYNNYILHLNFRVIFKLFSIRHNVNLLILGGSWNAPVAVLTLLFRKIVGINKMLFWAEANRHSQSISAKPVLWFRNFLVRSVDGFICPGEVAIDTISNDWGFAGKRFFSLPNIVDEKKIPYSHKTSAESKSNLADIPNWLGYRRRFVITARLFERDKGVVNFLTMIKEIIKRDTIIVILGDGPDRNLVENFISSNSLTNIVCVGWVDEKVVLNWYSEFDAFILPSFRDPYPLSAIEALWCGLPLLLSQRCGNFVDVVSENVNGFSFDPCNSFDVVGKFTLIQDLTDEEIELMGKKSRELAFARFSSDKIVRQFVEQTVSFLE